jgi:Fungal trichothecene efflux pump (TRI12)
VDQELRLGGPIAVCGRSDLVSDLRSFDSNRLLNCSRFILGLEAAGNGVWSWGNAATVSFIIIGFCCLVALFVWETFAKLKEPLIPMHFFRDRGWLAAVLSLSLGASVFYSQAVIWPQMVANVYANGRIMWGAWVANLVGIGVTSGMAIGGSVAKLIGYTKWQCVTAITLSTLSKCCSFVKKCARF